MKQFIYLDNDIDSSIKSAIFNVVNAEAKLDLGAKIGKDKNISNTTQQIIEKTIDEKYFS